MNIMPFSSLQIAASFTALHQSKFGYQRLVELIEKLVHPRNSKFSLPDKRKINFIKSERKIQNIAEDFTAI